MIFLSYLLVLGLIFFVRYRHLEGRHLVQINSSLEGGYFSSGSQDPKQALYYGVKQENGIPFIIKPERWYHRVLVFLHLAREVRIHDRDADKRFFIMADTPEHLAKIFSDASFIENLNHLFDLPVKALYSVKDRLWIKTKPMRFYKKYDIDSASDIYSKRIQYLRNIRDSLHRPVPCSEKKNPISGRSLAIFFLSIHAALITLVIAAPFILDHDHTDLIDTEKLTTVAIIVGGFIAILWGAVLFICMVGKSWFGWVMADFIVFGFIGILTLSGIMLREANIRLDHSTPQTVYRSADYISCQLTCTEGFGKRRHSSLYKELPLNQCINLQETILAFRQKDRKCQKGHRFEFYLEFSELRADENSPYKIEVPYKIFIEAARKVVFAIPVHAGRIGSKWIDKKTIRKLGDPPA